MKRHRLCKRESSCADAVRRASAACLCLVLAACGRPPAAPEAAPPEVTVARPIVRQMREFIEGTGLLKASDSVEVRAQVTGYLAEIHFKDGADLAKGDLLFTIDPRPFQAAVAQGEAEVRRAEAQRAVAEAEFKRAESVRGTGVVSIEEIQSRAAALQKAEADLIGAKAALEGARLSLEYTQIRAPFAGRASEAALSVGNLVTSGGPVLTTIVASDWLDAAIDLDENEVHRLARMRVEGKLPGKNNAPPAFVAVGQEPGFDREGVVDFIDNRIDPETGTLRVRVRLPNAKADLAPGMFARVRIPLGQPAPRLLVTERAIGTNQNLKFVYVIDERDVAQDRVVTLGRAERGLQVVESGVKPGERVVVNGLLRVRPGARVRPTEMPMPAPPDDAAAPDAKPAVPVAKPAAPAAQPAPAPAAKPAPAGRN